MSELFSNDNIFLNVNVNNQNEAIEKAGKALVDSGAVTDAYIQAMKDREQVVSTFMGNGLAIPHGTDEAKTNVIHSGLTLQIPEGVDWDGEVVKVVVELLVKMANIWTCYLKLQLHLRRRKCGSYRSKQNLQKKLNKYSRRQMHNESSSLWCW